MEKKTQEQKYEEWMQKIRNASGAANQEAEVNQKAKTEVVSAEESVSPQQKSGKKFILVYLIFFLLAFIPRMIFIFFIGNPDNPGAGWFGDAYHHWQIAYLTYTVGMGHGFLRLWDLKGMEFFWGLLHPLIMMIMFFITGNHTVGLERSVTAFSGSLSVVLLFIVVRRFWNTKTAVAAALFAALNPVGVFNDGSGMVEPLGIPFLLLGVYLWPKKPILSGLAFAIALTARAEYWAFSLGLVLAMIILSKVELNTKMLLSFGFFVPFIAYMKYLSVYTNNPIYPFYENYLTNIFGTWQLKQVLSSSDILGKYLFIFAFLLSALCALLVIKIRPKGMYFYLLGIGNWLFLGATFGFSAYIKSYETYVWYVRFMILPYMFLGAVLAIFLFYYLPKKKHFAWLDKIQLTWFFFLIVLLVSQLVWILIWNKYSVTQGTWLQSKAISDEIAANYRGGGLLLFEGNPDITYALVRYHNIQGKNIVGEMFDPYYYFTSDPYADWPKYRKTVLDWLKQNNIRTIATYVQYQRYANLAKNEPEFISKGVFLPGTNLIIYEVKDALYQQKI